jgi:hypothetical protein
MRALSLQQRSTQRVGLSLEQCLNALRIVARHLNLPGITRTEYHQARLSIVQPSLRSKHGQQASLLLPDLLQIEGVFTDNGLRWGQALERAGLEDVGRRRKRRGLSPSEAVSQFAEHTGHVPLHRQQVYEWGRATGVPIGRASSGGYAKQIESFIASRQAAGEPPLAVAARDLSFAELAPIAAFGHRNTTNWDKQRIIAGMITAIGYLGHGEELGIRQLSRIAAEHPGEGIPSASVVTRHAKAANESFQAWRRKAYRLIQDGRRRP